MNAFKNAANSYKKTNPEGKACLRAYFFSCLDCLCGVRLWTDERVMVLRVIAAVSALHQAIKLLIQSGNFRQAADREKEVCQTGHDQHIPISAC